MTVVLVVLLAIVTLAMIGTILLQKSEGGGLTGSQSPMSGVMSARGAANFLTRTTAILASLFMIICIILALQSRSLVQARQASAFDKVPISPVSSTPSPAVPISQ